MYLFFFLSFTTLACAPNAFKVTVPAQQSIMVNNNGFATYEATIKNKSGLDLEVAVKDKISLKQTSGFGLGRRASVDVIVNETGVLHLANPTNKDVQVSISQKEMDTTQIMRPKQKDDYVSFTLLNNTAKSIPLIIPTVMNPNLSPFSTSGVDLKYGQKIFFKVKGRRQVLLIVDDSIQDGDKIKVGQLIKERKKELGI